MGVPVFRSAGDPADPAVLLVHGYPATSHMWRPALAVLAERGLYAVAHEDAPATAAEALAAFLAEVAPR